jgi:hypothetical protein
MVKLKDAPDQVKERWEDRNDKLNSELDLVVDTTFQRVAKILVTGNAGGAIVVLSFMASLLQSKEPISFLMCPLALFLVGVCFVGLASIVDFLRASARFVAMDSWYNKPCRSDYDLLETYKTPVNDESRYRFVRICFFISGVQFVFGISFGMFMLWQLP